GEIFVLDMGNPIRIVDLARQLILLSGLRPDQDINIEFTGVRPGEKLYEELSANDEETLPTYHEKIHIFTDNGSRLPDVPRTSADGYIARLDGSVDWLDRPSTAGDYGMSAFLRRIDTTLWGRTTYEQALAMDKAAGFGSQVKNYVFSHSAPPAPAPEVDFVNE